MPPGSSSESLPHSAQRAERPSGGEETPVEATSAQRPREEDGATGAKDQKATLEDRIALLKGEE